MLRVADSVPTCGRQFEVSSELAIHIPSVPASGNAARSVPRHVAAAVIFEPICGRPSPTLRHAYGAYLRMPRRSLTVLVLTSGLRMLAALAMI